MQLTFVSDELAKSVKKSSNADRVAHYKVQFRNVEKAAQTFEAHDVKNDALHYAALQAVFDFGQQIRAEPEVLEEFVRQHELPWSKVTAKNPYNALIRLALPASTKKAWLSQCSTVLEYAHDRKINEPLSQWLEGGGVSGRYKEAVEHFARGTTGKAGRSKVLRLQTAKDRLTASPLTEALSGVDLTGSAPGFFRSLVYYDGTKTQLVHVRDTPDDAATETYLLDLVGPADVRAHPLADKQLFHFYRAIDLIVGSCGAPAKDEERHILIWNDEQDDEAVTRLRLVSDAYTFTNAAMTLADSILELEATGPLLLSHADAQAFRKDFQFDEEWRFDVQGPDVHLANSANSPMRLRLLPLAGRKGERRLREGAKPTRRTKHFHLTMDQMQGLVASIQTTRKLFDKQNKGNLTPYPKPKRFQLAPDGNQLCLDMQELPNVRSTFLTFKKPGANFHPHRELAIADTDQLCQALAPYGDDVTGYFVGSDVEDAALCLDHSFLGGDHFEYASPLVISVKMDRTLICDDLTVAPLPPQPPLPSEPASPSGPSKGQNQSSKQRGSVTKPLSTGLPMSPSGPPLAYPGGSAVSAGKPGIDPEDACPSFYSKALQDNWRSKRLKGVIWPPIPYKSGNLFGAYINSFMPDDAEKRLCRQYDLEWQLRWWRRMTDIPVTVIASGWTDEEAARHGELNRIGENGGRIIRAPARAIIDNRRHGLQEFYDSDHDWGIMMDDDATLHHGLQHNSGAAFFSEMAANDPAAYAAIDVFSPFTGKMPSHNVVWRENAQLFKGSHVFDPYYDLKGSLYVVRNFRKLGRPEILPPETFRLHGEDTLFGIEAISKGASVYRCDKIVLRELRSGGSSFPDRETNMKIGNTEIARLYAHEELKMGRTHLLDRKAMLRLKGRSDDRRIVVAKPR